jgi:hydroxymethylbilane synthase
MFEKPLKIGTRGSPLALAQAEETKRRLKESFPDELGDEDAIEINVIKSTGDMILNAKLSELGGKGLFTKELDVALQNKAVDICVHSMKDVPTDLAEGTVLPCNLPREETNDVWISEVASPKDLPNGSLIGSASLRRVAQLKRINPTFRCCSFRGNVQTRLDKIYNQGKFSEQPHKVDSTLLALAGFKRMQRAGKPLDNKAIKKILTWDESLPAISQGAIGIQCREGDSDMLRFLAALTCADTKDAVDCERGFLKALDGNCKTPIAGQAKINEDGSLYFRGLVLSADGSKFEEIERTGDRTNAAEMGREAAEEIKSRIGDVEKYIGTYDIEDEPNREEFGESDGLGGYADSQSESTVSA